MSIHSFLTWFGWLLLGIFSNLSLPEAILQKYREGWRNLITLDFLNINYLSSFGRVSLINGELEKWRLLFSNDSLVLYLEIEFKKHWKKMVIQEFVKNEFDTERNCKRIILSIFNSSNSVYNFVLSLSTVTMADV